MDPVEFEISLDASDMCSATHQLISQFASLECDAMVFTGKIYLKTDAGAEIERGMTFVHLARTTSFSNMLTQLRETWIATSKSTIDAFKSAGVTQALTMTNVRIRCKHYIDPIAAEFNAKSVKQSMRELPNMPKSKMTHIPRANMFIFNNFATMLAIELYRYDKTRGVDSDSDSDSSSFASLMRPCATSDYEDEQVEKRGVRGVTAKHMAEFRRTTELINVAYCTPIDRINIDISDKELAMIVLGGRSELMETSTYSDVAVNVTAYLAFGESAVRCMYTHMKLQPEIIYTRAAEAHHTGFYECLMRENQGIIFPCVKELRASLGSSKCPFGVVKKSIETLDFKRAISAEIVTFTDSDTFYVNRDLGKVHFRIYENDLKPAFYC